MSDFEGFDWGEFDDSDQAYNDYWSDGGSPYDGTDRNDPEFWDDGPYIDESDPEPDDGEGPFPVLSEYGRAREEDGEPDHYDAVAEGLGKGGGLFDDLFVDLDKEGL